MESKGKCLFQKSDINCALQLVYRFFLMNKTSFIEINPIKNSHLKEPKGIQN